MTPRERASAVLGRLGCVGVTGLLIFFLILAFVARDWFPPASAVLAP